MGLNDIILQPTLIKEIYGSALVLAADYKPVKKESKISFLGGNNKGYTVLVNCPDSMYLPDTQLAFLTKILSACNLSTADVAIVNTCTNADLNFDDIIENLLPNKILLFDIDMRALGFPLTIPHYQVQKHGGLVLLLAPALDALKENAGEKKKLWGALKQIIQE